MSLVLSIPVNCCITPTFFSAVILKKPKQSKKQLQKQAVQPADGLAWLLFWMAIFPAGLYCPECLWRKKKKKPRCSCLAGLRTSFVLVMQWLKFSPVVLWYNRCERGQVQVTVLVSCCVWFPLPTRKVNVLRSITAIFSCPAPPLPSRLLSFLPELSCGIGSFSASCFFGSCCVLQFPPSLWNIPCSFSLFSRGCFPGPLNLVW